MRYLFIPLFLLVSLVLSPVHAWWNKDWDYRKEFSIDPLGSGLEIENSLSDVTVLIRLHLGNFNYFTDTLPAGEDLRFVAGDDVTPLKFHIEKYDPVAQMAMIWVKVPRISPGTTVDKFYMYYGNQNAVAGSEPSASYDLNDVLVYHFNDEASVQDSTAYGNHAIENTALFNSASIIGNGVELVEAGQAIIASADTSLRFIPSDGLTLSAWVNIENPQENASVLAYRDETVGELSLRISGGVPYVQFVGADGTSFVTGVEETPELALASWSHIAFTLAEDEIRLFINGTEVKEAKAEIPEIGGTLILGSIAEEPEPFVGKLDELRVSNIVRSDEWIYTMASTQGIGAALVKYGADGQQEGAGGGHNYFAFTLQRLTGEGKITTGILVVMTVFALMVMFAKGRFVSKVRKGNRKFIERYEVEEDEQEARNSHQSLEQLHHFIATDKDELTNSSLFRLFDTGMREVHVRIGSKGVGAQQSAHLSSGSITAIRASMDSAMVRENQRLNSLMVLLTIAISGGPFIGLFGTVMGVMITFAEVAIAGTVDVTAIAPGIAAALVATIAGLGVAIPSLFGYNYLATRIKEINADMRVFVDEFAARLTEDYSD